MLAPVLAASHRGGPRPHGGHDGGPSLEGRVLDKTSPKLDFSREQAAARRRYLQVTEKSVLFVAPSPCDETFLSVAASDVWLCSDELVPMLPTEDERKKEDERSEGPASVAPRSIQTVGETAGQTPAQTAGGHWNAPLRTLPPEDIRVSGEWTSSLPALSISRSRRPIVTAEGLEGGILGHSTASRATRLGLALSLVFAGFALRAAIPSPVEDVPAGASAAPTHPSREDSAFAPQFVLPAGNAGPASGPTTGPPTSNEAIAPGLVFDALAVRVAPARAADPPIFLPRAPGVASPANTLVARATAPLFGGAPKVPPRTEVAGL